MQANLVFNFNKYLKHIALSDYHSFKFATYVSALKFPPNNF